MKRNIKQEVALKVPDLFAQNLRLSDRRGAERLLNLYIGHIKFNHTRVQWMILGKSAWEFDKAGRILEMVVYAAKKVRRYMNDTGISTADHPLSKQINKWESITGRAKDLEALKSIKSVAITEEELDQNTRLFNVKNGTLNLDTQELQDHNPDDLITRTADVVFDSEAKAPTWENFLNKVFPKSPSVIGFLQMFVGSCLCGLATFDRLVFLYGSGKNGKSIFIQVIMMLLGSYAIKIPSHVILRDRFSNSNQVQNEIARMKGKRLVVTAETDEGLRLSEATVKDLTGNDILTGNYKYRDTFQFQPTHSLLMYGNHKPKIKGNDNGIWRRIVIVPFNVVIRDEDKIPANVFLDTFKTEMSGILNWALAGYRKWQNWDQKLPGVLQNEVLEYRSDSDIISMFITENTENEVNVELKQSDLYACYTSWCKANGHPIIISRSLTLNLKDKGWNSRTGGGRSTIWIDKKLIDVTF